MQINTDICKCSKSCGTLMFFAYCVADKLNYFRVNHSSAATCQIKFFSHQGCTHTHFRFFMLILMLLSTAFQKYLEYIYKTLTTTPFNNLTYSYLFNIQ